MRIVLGNSSLARYPQGGGHWMVFLQYLLGLDTLGHDVFLLELMLGGKDRARDEALAGLFFDRLKEYGMAERATVLWFPESVESLAIESGTAFGRSVAQIRQIAREADVLWNFCGALRQPMLSLFRRRAFIDLDPGHLQVSALQCEMELREHDVFLTVGAKINDEDCEVPKLGLAWKPFLPVVHLPMWQPAPDPGPQAPFTSITHWTWEELWMDNRRLSISKREAYLRYLDLPRRAARRIQLAANIHPQDQTGDRELLLGHGWELAHPYDVAGTPAAYQDYIRNSRAELSCPKPIFRELKTGWLSDRSACYLASGRPVLAEDTGISDHMPAGEGLLVFRNLEEAVAGIAEIDRNYENHRMAARRLAEEFLDAGKTLSAMLEATQ